MTFRAVETLKSVELIAAEDTRQTVKLLNFYGISTPLTSYHEHNKDTKGPKLIEELKAGKDIALVSDAGMPGISDPGEDLIRLCIENEVRFTVVPGPTANITGLLLSGIGARSYVFEGFLPKNKKARQAVLNSLKTEKRTVVLYEAPHHLLETLKLLRENIGDRYAAATRELTKIHETVNRGTLSMLYEYFSVNEPKGEFVLVLEGCKTVEKEETFSSMSIREHFEKYIQKGMNEKEAMKQVAKDRGTGKREIYAALKYDK